MNAASIATARSRSQTYRFLSAGFGYPDAARLSLLQQEGGRLETSLARLRDRASQAAVRRLQPALEALALADLETSYVHCFGHTISKECPPYEAEYGQAHIFQKTQTLADIAGFYRAFGLDLATDSHDRVDHISVELEFMHFLCLKEAYALAKNHSAERLALCREAQKKFLRDHVCCWALGFARRLRAKVDDTLYEELGRLLTSFLTAELRALGLKPVEVAGPDVIEQPAHALLGSEGGERPSCEISCGQGGTQ